MTGKIYVAFLLFVVLVCGSTRAFSFEISDQCPTLPPDVQESVQRVFSSKPGDLFAVLKNGMTVLVRETRGNDVVSAQVFVRAGSVYENQYMTAGLSHYLEHVVSGGTTGDFTESQAKERLEKMGGITNAYTSYDRTVYYINTSAEHWKDALDLLTSYITSSVLDPKEVAREKPVIQQEYKMGENEIGRELWKLFLKTAYTIHPVRNPVIGYEEVFVEQSRDDLLDYFTRRYQPENMVVAVAGNVPPVEVLRFVAGKTRSFTRKADAPVSLPEEPPQTSRRWAEKELPMARLQQVMIGFPSVTMHDRDMYALDVLAILLGQGETCRLFCRLKDQENQVLNVGASNWTPAIVPGQFTISLALAPEFWPGVLSSMEEEINRFKTELVPMEELEKARKATIAQHVFGKETVSALASSMASSYFDTGDPYFDEVYVDHIRRVGPEEIRDVAQRYLRTERSTIAVIRPPRKAEEEKTAEASKLECEAPGASPVRFTQMKNGLKVLVKRDAALPMVTVQLYGLGGLLLEEPHQPGISAFTASLLTAGTAGRSKLEILRSIEQVGGEIENQSDNNTYHLSIKVLKEDLGMALDILSDLVQNARLPQEEIEKKRHETLLSLQRLDENWQAETVRFFKKSYFQRSPYEHDRLGTAESVQAFTREDLLQFYRRMVNPHHSVLAVFGDIDQDTLSSQLATKFEGWTGEPLPLPDFPEETHQITSSRTIEKKNDKTSAALFIGTNGLDMNDTDRPVLDVLDGLLSGGSYPGGRLFEALRGTQDLVYVVSAYPFYGKKAGFFGIISQTTMSNLDKVQSIILDHLHQLSREPVPEEELENAKRMILTAHKMELESLEDQAQTAALNEVLGLGWNYTEKYRNLIQAVTPEDILRLAKDLFAHTLVARTLPERPAEILAQPGS